MRARKRVAKVTGQTPKVTLCYEAGYDGFWLVRFLEQGLDDDRVLRRPLDHGEHMLVAVAIDAEAVRITV